MTEKKEKKMNDIKCLKVFLLFAGICLLLTPLAAYGHVSDDPHLHLSGRISTPSFMGEPASIRIVGASTSSRALDYLDNVSHMVIMSDPTPIVTDVNGRWRVMIIFRTLDGYHPDDLGNIQFRKNMMIWEKDGYTITPMRSVMERMGIRIP